jgi:hypothetical protein
MKVRDLSVLPKDPLLMAARVIIVVLIVILGFAAAALLLAAGYLAIDPSAVTIEFAKEGLAAPDRTMMAALIGVMLLALVPIALIELFLVNLLRLVESVSAGDPFNPVNAARLAQMGWLVLGVQLAMLPIGALVYWIGQRVKDADLDFGVSVEGVALALVLFILARVFRHGAAMREELEGTV